MEVHTERAGDFEIVKEGYLDIRDATDFGDIGGRDVAARTYSDLRAAGATNPEIVANPDTNYEGYAVELAIPFGITDGFEPTHSMGFDLFWRDVDVPEDFDELDPQGDAKPGHGGGGILWAAWNHAETVSGADEDGNLFHGGNWGSLVFGSQLAGDLNSDGQVDVADRRRSRSACTYTVRRPSFHCGSCANTMRKSSKSATSFPTNIPRRCAQPR